MKKITLIALVVLLAMVTTQSAWANDETRHTHGKHMHGPLHGDKNNPCSMGGMSDDMAPMKGAWMKKIVIDGFDVSFHIMKTMAGMAGGVQAPSHSVMIKVEQGGKVLTDLMVNSKVTHPNGKSESKMMMKMGDWYMVSYNLGHAGNHQLMVLFKTHDGAKHFGGISFSEVNP